MSKPADILIHSIQDADGTIRSFAQKGEARTEESGRFLRGLMENHWFVTTPAKIAPEALRDAIAKAARGWGLTVAVRDNA